MNKWQEKRKMIFADAFLKKKIFLLLYLTLLFFIYSLIETDTLDIKRREQIVELRK